LKKNISFKKIATLFAFALCGFNFNVWSQCTSFINNFPYQEDFENNNGGWTTGQSGAVLSDWTWGHPAKTFITTAGSGNKCWITGGLTNASYNSSELSYLRTPCFDFSTLQHPFIRFKVNWESEKNYDGATLQYSTNSGTSWNNLGAYNDPTNCFNANWFNNNSIQFLKPPYVTVNQGWSGSHITTGSCNSSNGSLGWVTAMRALQNLAGLSSVSFRFVFGSGTICNNYDGFAIDSVYIGETPTPISPVFNPIASVCIGAPAPVLPSFSLNGIPGVWSPFLNTSTAGSFNTTFTPIDNVCYNTYNQTFIVHPLPLNVEAGPDLFIPSGGNIQMQASASNSDSLTYQWYPSTGLSNATILNPIASPNQNTTYTLVAQTQFGCKDSDVVKINIDYCVIDPSKIFTPNHDGYYDTWFVYKGSCIKKVEAFVYNRWGGLVYNSTNYQNDWDGQYKNKPLPDGTYFYVLNLTENSGLTYTKKGSVAIIR